MNIISNLTSIEHYYKSRYGLDLMDKQYEIVEHNTPLCNKTFIRNRQEGSSTALCIKAIEFAINNQKSRVLMLSPNTRMCDALMYRLQRFLRRELLARFLFEIKNGTIYFTNGSSIRIAGGLNRSSIMGERADFLLIDNEEFLDKDVISSGIETILASPIGQCISIKTKKDY